MSLAAIRTTEGRINEQVEGIIIEVEVSTLFCRHATPGIKGAISRSWLEVDTAIFTCLSAIVSIVEVAVQVGRYLVVGPSRVLVLDLLSDICNI